MKKVYFIRHAESEGNVGSIRNTSLTPLSEKGRRQADIIAERCSRLPIEVIISSTFVRARETAETVSRTLSMPVQYSDLFGERRRPSEQLGKPKNDPSSLRAESEVIKNFAHTGYRFSDEENFDDLKVRAKNALAYIENTEEENILVITHGHFMKVILSHILFEDSLSGENCQNVLKKFHMENTGITVACYNKEKSVSPWWIWIWNDHSHLG